MLLAFIRWISCKQRHCGRLCRTADSKLSQICFTPVTLKLFGKSLSVRQSSDIDIGSSFSSSATSTAWDSRRRGPGQRTTSIFSGASVSSCNISCDIGCMAGGERWAVESNVARETGSDSSGLRLYCRMSHEMSLQSSFMSTLFAVANFTSVPWGVNKRQGNSWVKSWHWYWQLTTKTKFKIELRLRHTSGSRV